MYMCISPYAMRAILVEPFGGKYSSSLRTIPYSARESDICYLDTTYPELEPACPQHPALHYDSHAYLPPVHRLTLMNAQTNQATLFFLPLHLYLTPVQRTQ